MLVLERRTRRRHPERMTTMVKIPRKKLTLRTETLRTLTSTELKVVAGGLAVRLDCSMSTVRGGGGCC